MRTGLAASTVTPGSTPPDVSRTTPAIEACADATEGVSNASASTPSALANPRIACSFPTEVDTARARRPGRTDDKAIRVRTISDREANERRIEGVETAPVGLYATCAKPSILTLLLLRQACN